MKSIYACTAGTEVLYTSILSGASSVKSNQPFHIDVPQTVSSYVDLTQVQESKVTAGFASMVRVATSGLSSFKQLLAGSKEL